VIFVGIGRTLLFRGGEIRKLDEIKNRKRKKQAVD